MVKRYSEIKFLEMFEKSQKTLLRIFRKILKKKMKQTLDKFFENFGRNYRSYEKF